MGKIDAEAKLFFRNPEVVADLFNTFVFKEKIVDPAALKELDTAETVRKGDTGDAGGKEIEKARDVLVLALKELNGQELCVLGIENQASIDWGMVVRCCVYDVMQYNKQMTALIKQHEAKYKAAHPGKRYYGKLKEGDTLTPVKTVVVFLNSGEWNAPRTLHDIFGEYPDGFLKHFSNYEMALVVPSELDNTALEQYSSELREVFSYIKASKDKKSLHALVQGNERFETLSKDAANLINVTTDSKLTINAEEEVFNMCEALKEMRMDAIAEGRAEGRAEGEAKGRDEKAIEIAIELKGLLSDEVIAEKTKLPLEVVKALKQA